MARFIWSLTKNELLSLFRLFEQFSDMSQPIIFVSLTLGIVMTCIAMLIIQLEMVRYKLIFSRQTFERLLVNILSWWIQSSGENNSTATLIAILNVGYTFGLLLSLCELGQSISNTFIDINYGIGQLKWYIFPRKILRILPILQIMAGKPVNFVCLGSIMCDRTALKRVSCIKSRDWNYRFLHYSLFFPDNKQRIFILHDAASIWKIIG